MNELNFEVMITYKQITEHLFSYGIEQKGTTRLDYYELNNATKEDYINEFIELNFGPEYFILDGEVKVSNQDVEFLYSYFEDIFPNDTDKIILSSGEDKDGYCEYIYLYPIR